MELLLLHLHHVPEFYLVGLIWRYTNPISPIEAKVSSLVDRINIDCMVIKSQSNENGFDCLYSLGILGKRHSSLVSLLGPCDTMLNRHYQVTLGACHLPKSQVLALKGKKKKKLRHYHVYVNSTLKISFFFFFFFNKVF